MSQQSHGNDQQPFGAELARLRRRRGLSQQRLADLLCAAAGVSTVSRHEISRWERGQRIPGQPWLGWLSRVLETPLPEPVREPASRCSDAEFDAIVSERWEVLFRQLRLGRENRERRESAVHVPLAEISTFSDGASPVA